MIIFFDIETIPTTNPDVIEDLRKKITPPNNIKKADSIALWMDENREQALNDLVAKTSFDGMYGSVACVGFTAGYDAVFGTEDTFSEYDAITEFYYFINTIQDANIKFCGHNITGFDLPFLKHRSMILGIKPPAQLLKAMNAKPWDGCIADTMLMWNQDKQKRVSLDKLARALGIRGKDGFDGSMVANEWFNGDRSKVIEYCKNDVEITRKVYNRLTFNY